MLLLVVTLLPHTGCRRWVCLLKGQLRSAETRGCSRWTCGHSAGVWNKDWWLKTKQRSSKRAGRGPGRPQVSAEPTGVLSDLMCVSMFMCVHVCVSIPHVCLYCPKAHSIWGSPAVLASSLSGSSLISPPLSDLWFASEALPGKPGIWLAAWWGYWTVTGWDNYALSCRLAIQWLGLGCDL